MNIGKTILLLACACLAASGARADARSDVLTGIQRCGVIHDDRVWLDCVYGANQPMRNQLGLSPAPEFQQRLVPATGIIAPPLQIDSTNQPASRSAPRNNKKPGFWSNLIGAAPPEAVSRMASYRYDQGGAFIVTLENGQEWRQANRELGKITWLKKPSAYMVTISYGAFDSYSLRTSDSPQSYKVERLK
jgi:hypothetical protein